MTNGKQICTIQLPKGESVTTLFNCSKEAADFRIKRMNVCIIVINTKHSLIEADKKGEEDREVQLTSSKETIGLRR